MEEPDRDSPEIKACAKELMRQFPHLDYLMASTIAWAELEKKPGLTDKDAGEQNQTAVLGLDSPHGSPPVPD